MKPYLGRLKLSRLTVPALREFEDKLRQGDPAPGETEGNARSPAMVRRVMTSLSTMLSDSEERGLVARNVVAISGQGERAAKTASTRAATTANSGSAWISPPPEEIRAFVAPYTGAIGQSS